MPYAFEVMNYLFSVPEGGHFNFPQTGHYHFRGTCLVLRATKALKGWQYIARIPRTHL